MNVSSLDMSNPGEPKAGTANATIGGLAFPAAIVDPAPVPTTDEGGRATFTRMVPGNVYGFRNFTVTVPSIGSTATVPVFLKAPSSTRVEADSRMKAGRSLELEVQLRGPIAIAGTVTVALDGVPLRTFTWAPTPG